MSPRPETPNSSGASSVVALVRTPHEFAGPSLSVKLSGDAKRLSPLNQLVRQWPDFLFPPSLSRCLPDFSGWWIKKKKSSRHASPAHSSFARCFHPLGPTAHDLEYGRLRRQVSSLFNKPLPCVLEWITMRRARRREYRQSSDKTDTLGPRNHPSTANWPRVQNFKQPTPAVARPRIDFCVTLGCRSLVSTIAHGPFGVMNQPSFTNAIRQGYSVHESR